MSEFETTQRLARALLEQKRASDALERLKGRDIFINRSSLAQQANALIDARDAAQRKFEESLGDVSAGTRREIIEAFVAAFPNDAYGLQTLDWIRRIDGW